MVHMDRLEKLCSEQNGYITSSKLLKNNYTKYQIRQFVKEGILERVGRGQYVHQGYLVDEFLIYQDLNKNFIYSNETALYLLNLTDRYPLSFSVTTKHKQHLRNHKLKVYYVKDENYDLGVTTVKDLSGNNIKVYNSERTICDIIKNKNKIDTQIYVQGIQNYFLNHKPNLRQLAQYAKQLNMSKKVMEIVELYTKP